MKDRLRLRTARTSLVCGLLTFAASQFTLELAIENWWPGLRDEFCHQKLTQLKRRFDAAPPQAVKVVMLGTSATYCDLQSERLERALRETSGREVAVYNFGIPGSSALMELIALKRLLAEGIRPDVVLIEVLSPFLSGCPPLDPTRFSAPRFALSELPLIRRYTGHYSRVRWWDGRLAPCHAHRWAILRRLAPNFAVDDPWTQGVGPFDAAGAGHLEDEIRTDAGYRQGVQRTEDSYGVYRNKFRRDAPFCQILRELLSICRQEQIRAALVVMPESSELRGWYDWRVDGEMLAFLRELGGEYGADVIDAKDWIDDRGFLDGIHLVQSGAERFTGGLAGEVVLSKRPDAELAGRDGKKLR
ncbi:MAG TPA: hypothetical protein VN699_19500 [Pirellulales bacterium]|nr:hypothetical protein [Pirellulales bacterium]